MIQGRTRNAARKLVGYGMKSEFVEALICMLQIYGDSELDTRATMGQGYSQSLGLQGLVGGAL